VLDAAAEARRVVVLTSDHGHILGSNQRVVPAPGGERFRVSESPPGDDEVELSGGRVLRGDHRIVAPSDDGVRYVPTAKHGYHGGATPAEVLCPLMVLVYGDVWPAGWEPLAPQVPRWWDPDLAPVAVEQRAGPPPRRSAPRKAREAEEAQLSLLAQEPEVYQPRAPTWLSELLASSRLADQRRLAGRVTLDDQDLGLLLRVLIASNGTVSGAALQRTLDLPASRLRGKLEAARTLLNVDGYPVLRIEPDGTAALNVELLAGQFEIASLGGA
jgi:hypothetical protein